MNELPHLLNICRFVSDRLITYSFEFSATWKRNLSEAYCRKIKDECDTWRVFLRGLSRVHAAGDPSVYDSTVEGFVFPHMQLDRIRMCICVFLFVLRIYSVTLTIICMHNLKGGFFVVGYIYRCVVLLSKVLFYSFLFFFRCLFFFFFFLKGLHLDSDEAVVGRAGPCWRLRVPWGQWKTRLSLTLPPDGVSNSFVLFKNRFLDVQWQHFGVPPP